jgi:hypothetical protein
MITLRYLSVLLIAVATLQPALASPLRFTPSSGIKTGSIKGSIGVAYTLLNGKQAEVLKLYAQAPAGTVLSASLLKVNRVNARTLLLLNRGKSFSKLEFTETKKNTATIGSSAQAATAASAPVVAAAEITPTGVTPPTASICDGLSDVMIEIMIKQASQQFRRTITREEFCRPPSQNVPPSAGGSGGTSNTTTGLADRY